MRANFKQLIRSSGTRTDPAAETTFSFTGPDSYRDAIIASWWLAHRENTVPKGPGTVAGWPSHQRLLHQPAAVIFKQLCDRDKIENK